MLCREAQNNEILEVDQSNDAKTNSYKFLNPDVHRGLFELSKCLFPRFVRFAPSVRSGASAAEALLLVKFAIDLILSGEGPEYVEKQFFKYFRFDNYKTHERPKISEGLTPAQGKYLILRYAISKIEGDYGNTPEAADPNLYLPDLRKMEGIILGDDSFQQRNRESEREKAFHQDEGTVLHAFMLFVFVQHIHVPSNEALR